MSKANFACTMAYTEKEDKTQFPPETTIVISGIDKKSLQKKVEKVEVITVSAEDGGKPEEKVKEVIGEEK